MGDLIPLCFFSFVQSNDGDASNLVPPLRPSSVLYIDAALDHPAGNKGGRSTHATARRHAAPATSSSTTGTDPGITDYCIAVGAEEAAALPTPHRRAHAQPPGRGAVKFHHAVEALQLSASHRQARLAETLGPLRSQRWRVAVEMIGAIGRDHLQLGVLGDRLEYGRERGVSVCVSAFNVIFFIYKKSERK